MLLSNTRILAGKTAAAMQALQQAGARSGEMIVCCTASGSLIYVLGRAAAALGYPFCPLDPGLPVTVRQQLLQQIGRHLLVADDRDVPGSVFHLAELRLAADGDDIPPSRLADDDIALLMAGSGSSGMPKLAMLTSGNLLAAARAAKLRTPLARGDRWLACLPLFHIGGFSIPLRCDQAGAEAILLQGFSPQAVWQALHEERISHLSLVPAMLARLLALDATPPASLRHVLVSGAALPGQLFARAAARGWPLQPGYGLTEMASQVTTFAALPEDWSAGLVGPPLEGVELALSGDGCLKIRGPMLMAGYASPSRKRGMGLQDGWLPTRDLAHIDAGGNLWIHGRADDLIISGGKKIYPLQVEEALRACTGMDDCIVLGKADEEWGEIVTVVYQGSVDEEGLLQWCRIHLSSALRPRIALRLTELPKLANGKPDRYALRSCLEN